MCILDFACMNTVALQIVARYKEMHPEKFHKPEEGVLRVRRVDVTLKRTYCLIGAWVDQTKYGQAHPENALFTYKIPNRMHIPH
jgi:hypothetical protein